MKEGMDIRKLELGSIQPVLCAHCGTTHDFISSYNEKIARVFYRAIRDCPICSVDDIVSIYIQSALRRKKASEENGTNAQLADH